MKGLGRAARAVVAVALCLLVGSGLTGCGAMKSKTPSAGQADGAGLSAGDAAWARGDVEAAGRLYMEALKNGADPAKAHTRLGDLFLSVGAAQKAQAEYKQVLAANPKDAPALQGLGFALYLGGAKAEAVPVLTKALERDPGLTRAAALLGTIKNRQGHPEAALAVFDKSLAVTFDPDVENNRGLSLMLLGRPEEAADAFRKALAGRKIPKIANNLGLALCRLKRYDEAYATFASVGSQAAALNNLGVCYMEAGDKVRAQQYFERAIATNPSYYEKAQTNLSRVSAMEVVNLPSAAVPASAPPPGQPLPPASAPAPGQPLPATSGPVQAIPVAPAAPAPAPQVQPAISPAPSPTPPPRTGGIGAAEKTDRSEMP